WRSLTLHVLPDIGQTPIAKITAPKVIDLLRPLETKGSLETVKRVSQRLNENMTNADNSGLIHANRLSGIRAVFKKPKKQNMAALSPDELPELMVALANASIKRTTRALIEWQLHTMTCSGQLIPDTVLSFSSASAGAIPPLKACGRTV